MKRIDLPIWRCSCGRLFGSKRDCGLCERSHENRDIADISSGTEDLNKRQYGYMRKHRQHVRIVKREG